MLTDADKLLDAVDSGILEMRGYQVWTDRVVVSCNHCGASEVTQVTRSQMLEASNRRVKRAKRKAAEAEGESKEHEANRKLAEKAAERCRNEKGPCWCGCHVTEWRAYEQAAGGPST